MLKKEKEMPPKKITDRKDGGINYSITVNHLIEIKAWIMSWGSHATVVKPKELILELQDELKKHWESMPKDKDTICPPSSDKLILY